MISDQRLASKIYKELTHKQKNKHLDQKMGRKPEEIFLQRRHRDGQETDEKMLNITNHQGNGNTNHEILPHASQNGYYSQVNKEQVLVRGCGEKGTLVHCWWDRKLKQLL